MDSPEKLTFGSEKPIENPEELTEPKSDKDAVPDSDENGCTPFVFPQPIKIKGEEIDEAEDEEECLLDEDDKSEAKSEVFDREPSKSKSDFDLLPDEKLKRLTFLELLDYTKVLSSQFKKKTKKLKKLKEKTKYLVSYFRFQNANKSSVPFCF